MKHLKGNSIIFKSSIITLIVIVVCIGIWKTKSKPGIAIEFSNLNDENSKSITLSLEKGWTAQKSVESDSKSFTYKLKKNQLINEHFEYHIYNENEKEIGWFGILDTSNDRDNSALLDRYKYADLRYIGPTKLGKGRVYLVENSQNAENGDSNMTYFAIVPIEGEALAYGFKLNILEHEKTGDVFDRVRDFIITSDDVETQIRKLFQGENTSSENTEKIINLLPFIEWNKYAEVDPDQFSKIADWLVGLKTISKEHMVNLLSATNGLDGWYTDEYCYMLKGLFFNNKEIFVHAIPALDEEQAERVASFIQYACEPDELIQVVEYVINKLETEHLSDDERTIIEYHFFEKLQIELSGTLTTELFYEQPGYGENPETDAKVYAYILVLDTPLKAGELEISKVQVAFGDENMKDINGAKGKPIHIGGTLYRCFNGHHHTPVLISVDQFSEIEQ